MRYRNLWISWCRHWRLLILISYAASFPTNRKLLVKYTLRQPPIVHVNLFLFTIPSFIALKVVKTLKNDIEQNFFLLPLSSWPFLVFLEYVFIHSFIQLDTFSGSILILARSPYWFSLSLFFCWCIFRPCT